MKEKNWFNASYINQIELAVSRFPQLALTHEQFSVVLAILLLQRNNEIISVAAICNQTKLTKEKVNEILAVLTSKAYLAIKSQKSKIEFNLDGLFLEAEENIMSLDTNLFTLFEQEFGRVLTRNEVQMLASLQANYSQEQIEDALRKTLNNDVHSINYVAKILSKTDKKD